MGNLLLMAAAVFAGWWLYKRYGNYWKQLSAGKSTKYALAVLMALGGILLLARGQFIPGAILGIAGVYLSGWDVRKYIGLGRSSLKSQFASPMVDLEVDNLTGRVDGILKAGKYAGRRLAEMNKDAIQECLNDAVKNKDFQSAGLLQAYLNRRFSVGGEYAERDGNTRSGSVNPGTITEKEAYDILGLQPGASADDIKRAYRTLMKKLHPDHGGTAYLAARVNEAKDVLLNRH